MSKKKPPVIETDLSHITEQLRPLAVPIDQPILDPANARLHPEPNLAALKGSLRVYGQRKPIVVNRRTNVVEAGNGTLSCGQALGWSHIAAVYVDDDPNTAAGFAVSDNRTAELATWDDDALDKILREIQTGDEDLQAMLSQLAEDQGIIPTDEEAQPLGDPDEVPEPPVDPITKPGDLWILGDHRLLCGDSTKAEDVERLMGGAKAELIHTDPPYGVNFQSNKRTATPKFEVIANDDKVLTDWIPPAIQHSTGWVFVWTTWKVLAQWLEAVRPFGQISNMVVWHKGGGGVGDLKKTFSTDYELALVFHRGAELCGKRIGSVWSFNKDAAATYLHPTQKPVALAAEAIEKTTHSGSVVMDLFLGSGTTLIAAEQLARRCFGMELSPAYCDVIIKRWEKCTGRNAELAK